MSNDTERLLCGDCKHYFSFTNGCLGVCVHPQLERLPRTCDELGCDEWAPSNATENAQEAEAFKRLEAVVDALIAAAEAIKLLGTAETRSLAGKMYGAAEAITQWIAERKEA